MRVPFLDLGACYQELKLEIDTAVARVMESGRYIFGPEVEEFESEWAEYCEAKYAVGLGNGLDALILALRALNVGPGDEVIVPSNTYIATWLAVTAVGAKPIPVEPDPVSHNINSTKIAEAITTRTKVLLPVHLYGQPANMDPILSIAKKYGIAVVEDAAQAHGARYNGKRVGAHGDIVCWSFYPSKNLGALGDGGAITTDRSDLADKIKVLGNYGSRIKYANEVQGINSRLDPLQAAVLRVKLKHLDDWTNRRCSIAGLYAKELKNTGLTLPHVPKSFDPAWHLYVVRSINRDKVQKSLWMAGIETSIHYPIPPHMQQAYVDLDLRADMLPIATKLADEVMSLPIGPNMSQLQIRATIKAVKNAMT